MKRAVRIRGRVQGVGFRAFVAREAARLGVHGAVRNEADGTVRALLEGEPERLDRLEQRLGEGPPVARVDAVERLDAAAAADLSYDLTF